ncbi:hypothetical protein H4R33_005894, partial [Dimargaris cristalligena]
AIEALPEIRAQLSNAPSAADADQAFDRVYPLIDGFIVPGFVHTEIYYNLQVLGYDYRRGELRPRRAAGNRPRGRRPVPAPPNLGLDLDPGLTLPDLVAAFRPALKQLHQSTELYDIAGMDDTILAAFVPILHLALSGSDNAANSDSEAGTGTWTGESKDTGSQPLWEITLGHLFHLVGTEGFSQALRRRWATPITTTATAAIGLLPATHIEFARQLREARWQDIPDDPVRTMMADRAYLQETANWYQGAVLSTVLLGLAARPRVGNTNKNTKTAEEEGGSGEYHHTWSMLEAASQALTQWPRAADSSALFLLQVGVHYGNEELVRELLAQVAQTPKLVPLMYSCALQSGWTTIADRLLAIDPQVKGMAGYCDRLAMRAMPLRVDTSGRLALRIYRDSM